MTHKMFLAYCFKNYYIRSISGHVITTGATGSKIEYRRRMPWDE